MARGGPNETPKRNENQAPSGQKESPHSLGYDNSSLLQRCIKHDEIYHKQQMFIYIYISYSAVGQQIPLLKLVTPTSRCFSCCVHSPQRYFLAGNILKPLQNLATSESSQTFLGFPNDPFAIDLHCQGPRQNSRASTVILSWWYAFMFCTIFDG